MCGIAGTFGVAGAGRPEQLLLEMASELLHRGPDGIGLYVDRQYGMVNTRLSIIDLANGDQPLPNETGRYWAMQNGEIYNYPELRAELECLGHRFVTACDTEVLVHAYESWGAECLHRLNGDFAFAIWDTEEQELFLARDRFGVRPLFLAEPAGGLLFASEAKALLRHPLVARELDPAGLVETFSLWSSLPDRSVFRGIRELPPAHYLRMRAGARPQEKCWWHLDFSPAAGNGNDEELAAELRHLLEEATKVRLRADVPVGAYLSGGIDSCTIAALTKRLTAQERRSFSIGFDSAPFDESEYQDRMARELGTDLERIVIGAKEIRQHLPEAVRLAERPLLRTAPVPMLLLSGLVRSEGFKVVLTGEGADELFAGYHIFKESKLRRFWARQPGSPHRPRLLTRLYPFLSRDLGRSGEFLKRFFEQHLTETDDPLYSHRLRMTTTSRTLRFFRRSFLAEAETSATPETRLLATLPEGFHEMSDLGKAQHLEIVTFLHGYLLHAQGDRMLMGNSVEGRFPFLDHRVAEFAGRLPDRLKLRGMREKHLLRRAVAPLLPKEIGAREKRPYRSPIGTVFSGERGGYVDELLAASALDRSGIFDPLLVDRLMQKCSSSDGGMSESDEMALVGVISTMLLHEQLIRQPVLPKPVRAGKMVRGRELEALPSAGRP